MAIRKTDDPYSPILKSRKGGDKPNWTARILFALFVAGCLAAIVWMVKISPPLKPLVCDPGVHPSLTTFGTCHTE
ncbi:MAG: hypothetical protein KGI97_01780 [Alphaproteobacteria bacterium]|nr:hypothetical protein [Alphaproteobacteria bacterium]